MHIMEGFLPPVWAVFWYAVSLVFVVYGAVKSKRLIDENPKNKALLAVAGGFIFVLSSLKIPSPVTGSCSHPTGTGISTMLFGPSVTAFLSAIVLLYQALLLAHGGLTTLGANTASMGIVGPFAGWLVYRALKGRVSLKVNAFITAVVADWFTYVVTSLQLALAFPGTSMINSALTFMGIFALTQIPVAIVEGIFSALLIGYIAQIDRNAVKEGVVA
ncbi:energy-coupling factor ABC transporter permease [Geoglobus acetivorans]|uniref:Putative cobalt transport protein CbiM n=1 Tax=Geoglobus acetivorans TaxID=565033 RepID=A0A0A7GIS8_GEOAI|nr:Substrate-specific component CbiM of cobalt ECF transporter [Geoglobus acetivorans]